MEGMFARDAKGEAVILFEIWRLTPHESREFSLTYPGTAMAQVASSIAHSTTEPQARTGNLLMKSGTYYADELLHPEHLFNVLVDGRRVEGDVKR
jgi:hypothetical protein